VAHVLARGGARPALRWCWGSGHDAPARGGGAADQGGHWGCKAPILGAGVGRGSLELALHYSKNRVAVAQSRQAGGGVGGTGGRDEEHPRVAQRLAMTRAG
jgi:hypothetical protein